MRKLKKGDVVLYKEDDIEFLGEVFDIEDLPDGSYTFSIEGFSDCCAGFYKISSYQIGLTVFLQEKSMIKNEEKGI